MLWNSDLRQEPHMSSKYTAWKKDYAALVYILSRSGFGWNEAAMMIDAIDELWKELEHAKVKNVQSLRKKRCPLYPDWCEIFGNDRATGHGRQTFKQATQPQSCDSSDTPPIPEVRDHAPPSYDQSTTFENEIFLE